MVIRAVMKKKSDIKIGMLNLKTKQKQIYKNTDDYGSVGHASLRIAVVKQTVKQIGEDDRR